MSKIGSNFWKNFKLDVKNNLLVCNEERGDYNK